MNIRLVICGGAWANDNKYMEITLILLLPIQLSWTEKDFCFLSHEVRLLSDWTVWKMWEGGVGVGVGVCVKGME